VTPLDSMALWQRTLARQGDPLDARREVLRQALLGFRERVAALVQTLYTTSPTSTRCGGLPTRSPDPTIRSIPPRHSWSAAPFCCTMRRM
jgi:hypothetical protein